MKFYSYNMVQVQSPKPDLPNALLFQPKSQQAVWFFSKMREIKHHVKKYISSPVSITAMSFSKR